MIILKKKKNYQKKKNDFFFFHFHYFFFLNYRILFSILKSFFLVLLERKLYKKIFFEDL